MGDLIFFRSAGVGRVSDHVGLVRYVKGGRVYTVEGNSSGQVALRDYALGDTYIVGYGRPNYGGVSRNILRTAHEDVSAGHYLVTYDFLNVRAGRAATTAKKGSLQKGELVKVDEVKNGWGRIQYEGGVAYISLEYADFVAPSAHKVAYVSEGKTLLSRDFFSTDKPTVSAFTPEREGYEFLGWEDVAQKQYQSGAPLSTSVDTILTAVWRELPPPPDPEPTPEETPPANDTQDGADTPPLQEQAPDATPPNDSPGTPSAPDFALASLIAGVLSFLVAAAWIGTWVWLRLRKKEV
jgi:hypothetical protein